MTTKAIFLSTGNQSQFTNSLHLNVDKTNNGRRHSESSVQNQSDNHNSDRRTSYDVGRVRNIRNTQQMILCRNPICQNTATLQDAKLSYKKCHNCSHLYCSRECRRVHWIKKHRQSCLSIHFSVLCRRILSTCKDDLKTLSYLSVLALRGFASNGRGVVRILFKNSESASHFIENGYRELGQVSYVKNVDLSPVEMGPELYQELLKISIEYNPFKKMLLYVAVCIVFEPNDSKTLDLQLVSRCAKLKLCKTIINDLNSSLISSAEMRQKFTSNAKNKSLKQV